MGLSNFVRISIESSQTPAGIEARRFAVELMDSPVKQLVARAINEVIFFRPQLWHPNQAETLAAMDADIIGQGCEALCIRRGQQVIKSVVASVGMSEQQRQDLAREKQKQFEQLEATMGSVVLPQMITVDTHPYKPQKRTVQTIQPFVEYEPFLTATEGHIQANHDVLDDSEQQLYDFVAGAWDMYDSTGLLPDTTGKDNVVAVNRKLVLIDTQPIPTTHQGVQSRIKRQLDDLVKKR